MSNVRMLKQFMTVVRIITFTKSEEEHQVVLRLRFQPHVQRQQLIIQAQRLRQHTLQAQRPRQHITQQQPQAVIPLG